MVIYEIFYKRVYNLLVISERKLNMYKINMGDLIMCIFWIIFLFFYIMMYDILLDIINIFNLIENDIFEVIYYVFN